MIRAVGILIISVLILTGCGSDSAQEEVDPAQTSSEASPSDGEWMDACARFSPDSVEGFGVAYDAVIKDYCSRVNPKGYDFVVEFSPTVAPDNLTRYLDSQSFHESYWDTRMNPEYDKPVRVVFSEADQQWWEQKQKQYLLNPDLDWFTSTSEGGHCRVQADIFCPKNFEAELTTIGAPVEFRIIGSKLSWQDFQKTNGAHESVHLYQDSHGQSHWAFWYIEGQATFFELAMARLLFNSDHLRQSFVVENPRNQDSLVFEPTSPNAVADYFDKCNWSKNGGCDSFKYGVGSLFHEKLVLDYGLETYFLWQNYLNENMPKGNPSGFTNAQNEKVFQVFNESFIEFFGVSQSEFENQLVAEYVYEYFSNL